MVLTCPFCGEGFTKRYAGSTQKYCSAFCRRAADNERKKQLVYKGTRKKKKSAHVPEAGLNRKLAVQAESGAPYAEQQKAETIELYARVEV